MQHPLLLAPLERQSRTSSSDAFVFIPFAHTSSWPPIEYLPIGEVSQGGRDHVPITLRHGVDQPRTSALAVSLRAHVH